MKASAKTAIGSDGEGVVLIKQNHIATIWLDRPDSGNAIDLGLARALKGAMQSCERDPQVRAIVIRGRGRLFCAGGDLFAIRQQGDAAPAYVKELLSHLHEALSLIATIKVPVVAAVNGTAAGAGLALASACDLTVAIDSAKFVMAYTKVGLTPDASSTWFLPRLIGLKRALDLTLTNRPISAAEAREWGLVSEVLSEREFEPHVEQLAANLARGATAAFGFAKQLLRTSQAKSLDEQMQRESDILCSVLATAEATEGLNEFALSKRER